MESYVFVGYQRLPESWPYFQSFLFLVWTAVLHPFFKGIIHALLNCASHYPIVNKAKQIFPRKKNYFSQT
jgi:hypothetical protein